jgi:anti-anti-sigma factor
MNSTSLYEVEQIGRTVVVTPVRDLDEFSFEEMVSQAESIFDPLSKTLAQSVVIDLCNVENCQSSAFGFFVKLAKRAKEAGGKMAVCNASARITEMTRVLNLDKVWAICDTRGDALADVEN